MLVVTSGVGLIRRRPETGWLSKKTHIISATEEYRMLLVKVTLGSFLVEDVGLALATNVSQPTTQGWQ